MKELSFWDFILFVSSANLSRYFIISGLFFGVYYKLFKNKWREKKIQSRYPKNKDYRREIMSSVLTLCIFVCFALLIFKSPLSAFTQRYNTIDEMGWGYWWWSIIVMIFIHDTYFYWTHRAMHHPLVYRQVHWTHHKSTNPSPWAAFAFHPIEAVVEAGIVFLIAFLIPFHISALTVFLIFMTLYNAYGHLGFELYPKNFYKTWIGRWLNTSVAHNQHHEKFKGNYGLYFLFWDRWMGTLRSDYASQYDLISQKRKI